MAGSIESAVGRRTSNASHQVADTHADDALQKMYAP